MYKIEREREGEGERGREGWRMYKIEIEKGRERDREGERAGGRERDYCVQGRGVRR